MTYPSIPRATSSFGFIHHNYETHDRIYIVGGHPGQEHRYLERDFCDDVFYLDLRTREWNRGTPRPIPSQGFRMASHNQFLYAFGGSMYDPNGRPPYTIESTDVIHKYDTLTDTWTTLEVRLPDPRSSYAAGVVGDVVYFIGGWNIKASHWFTEVDSFDLNSEMVQRTKFVLPNPVRRALGCVSTPSGIVLAGGLTSKQRSNISDVTLFDPQGEKSPWTQLTALPDGLFAPGVGVRDDELFVLGGAPTHYDENYTHAIIVLPRFNTSKVSNDPQGNKWWFDSGSAMKVARSFVEVAFLSDAFVAFGGHANETHDERTKRARLDKNYNYATTVVRHPTNNVEEIRIV